jgi:hypothetical protein
VPLRSVEAATRDDAIAAAREQFGPAARVVGVRRVRSGGVLGFFATERYVAEVAPDPFGVPGLPVPAPARPAGALTEDPDTGSLAAFGSPLASAAPARARTAPPRNGAAAWAAEAARPTAAASRPESPAESRPAFGAGDGTAADRRAQVPAARSEPADDARVDELAGLLGAPSAPPARQPWTPTVAPRSATSAVAPKAGVALASFPRTTREDPAPARADDLGGDDDASSTGAPSPFTAALARMVAGDRDVQHAVREALETSDAVRPGGTQPEPEPEPELEPEPEPEPTIKPTVWTRATRQKEETVGDQVIAPPSTSVDERTEFANWVDEPPFPAESFPGEHFAGEHFAGGPFASESLVREPSASGPPACESFPSEPSIVPPPVAALSPVSREEAIAEVLRAALAEGHSDDALAGILRRVVAGDAPQNSVAEPAPAVASEPAPELLVEAPVAETTVEVPVAEAPVEVPVVEVPVEVPAAELPAPVAVPEQLAAPAHVDLFAPLASSAAPVPAATEAVPSAAVLLWGEVTPASTAGPRTAEPDAHIWGTVTQTQPAAEVSSTPADEAGTGTSLFGSAAAPAVATASPEHAARTEHLITEHLITEHLTTEPAAEDVGATEVGTGEPAATEATAVESTAVESTAVESTAVESTAVEGTAVEAPESARDLDMAPVLARTASDPAPVGRSMTMDQTTVMPPLSLLPGSPSRGRGLPPVPPRTGRPPVPPSHSRIPAGPTASAASTDGKTSSTRDDDVPASADRMPGLLATVTRLPVGPLMATAETPDMPELADLADLADLIEADASGLLDGPVLPAAVPARPTRVRIDPPSTPAEVLSRLTALGVPADLLGPTFTDDVAADGTYAALTRALGQRLPEAPELPTGAGDVLFVVGPGVETLRAARSLAATMRLDPDRVQWATRGDLVGLSPEATRMSTIEAALRRRQDASTSGSVTIVAVDAPLRTDAYWMAQMLAIWSPVAVWAVVEATRKPEDLEHWLDGLARVDALIVQDTDLSADPAVVLDRLAAPVAVVDGLRATPHRWASVLCERLESAPA